MSEDYKKPLAPPPPRPARMQVQIVDIEIPFWSMMVLITKFLIAAIPAIIILSILAVFLSAIFGAVLMRL